MRYIIQGFRPDGRGAVYITKAGPRYSMDKAKARRFRSFQRAQAHIGKGGLCAANAWSLSVIALAK